MAGSTRLSRLLRFSLAACWLLAFPLLGAGAGGFSAAGLGRKIARAAGGGGPAGAELGTRRPVRDRLRQAGGEPGEQSSSS